MRYLYNPLAAGHYCLLLWLLVTLAARAQAPAWSGAASGSLSQPTGVSTGRAVATDARGNVFVAGYFTGSVAFGSTVLTSAGYEDVFVAKYVPATNTWAWAQSGGGISPDYSLGIAVSGTSVYVACRVFNNASDAQGVRFGGTSAATGSAQVKGASATASEDWVLAKYTDNGTTATLGWTQVGGGTDYDFAFGVAASGSSVYVVGTITNNVSNARAVVFGGTGTAAGTTPVYGVSAATYPDWVVAKYTDNGPTATLNWTQVAGGTGNDIAYGVAVSGSSLYVTGICSNSQSNQSRVLFGGTGTTVGTSPQAGASPGLSLDWVVAKYIDNGSSATFQWSQVGGGLYDDYPRAVAVSGSSVYVVGTCNNSRANPQAVVFGGSGSVPGTSPQYGASSTASQDLVLAKYTDNGPTAALGWTQVAGGTGNDAAFGVAASGSSVYVVGSCINNSSNSNSVVAGGSGTTAGAVPVAGVSAVVSDDLVLAKYTDNGASASLAWAQVGGGPANELGYGVAVSGQGLFVTGYAGPAAVFGPTTIGAPAGGVVPVLAYATDPTLLPLPTRAASPGLGLTLAPNPASGGGSALSGVAPGQFVQVFDALGRLAGTADADATGTAALNRLPPGLYLVRAGTATVRLTVE